MARRNARRVAWGYNLAFLRGALVAVQATIVGSCDRHDIADGVRDERWRTVKVARQPLVIAGLPTTFVGRLRLRYRENADLRQAELSISDGALLCNVVLTLGLARVGTACPRSD